MEKLLIAFRALKNVVSDNFFSCFSRYNYVPYRNLHIDYEERLNYFSFLGLFFFTYVKYIEGMSLNSELFSF
jgi:hypothetical protein